MAPKKVVMKHAMKAAAKKAASTSTTPKTSVKDVKLWAENGDVLKRPSAALDERRNRNKNYQFFGNFYTELPDHIKEMYQGTNKQKKQTAIINAVMRQDAMGKWGTDTSHPMFEDCHRNCTATCYKSHYVCSLMSSLCVVPTRHAHV